MADDKDPMAGQKTFSISSAPHRCHFTDCGLMVACNCGAFKEAVPEDDFDDLDTAGLPSIIAAATS